MKEMTPEALTTALATVIWNPFEVYAIDPETRTFKVDIGQEETFWHLDSEGDPQEVTYFEFCDLLGVDPDFV